MEDINGLDGIRVNDIGNEIEYNEEQPSIPKRRRSIFRNGHYADALTNGNVEQLDLRYDGPIAEYGQSKYDEENGMMFSPTAEKIKDNRFERQSGLTQIGAGLAKGVITAGTTFVDGLAMMTLGVAKGLGNMGDSDPKTGFWEGVWNNEVTKTMQSINDWSEDVFKNYYSSNQENSAWYSANNLFSTNFLGDKILKNMGFMVGAYGSGAVLTAGKLLPKTIFSAVKGLGGTGRTAYRAAKSVAALEGSAISAISEGGIEALNNSTDWRKTQVERINTETELKLLELENLKSEISEDTYNFKKQEYLNAKEQALQKIDEDAIRMGNIDMLINLPILMAENTFAWGRLYASGFKNATRFGTKNISKAAAKTEGKSSIESLIKSLENDVKHPVLKGARKGATRSVLEGNEEMAQAWASEFAGIKMQQDVDNYYDAALNNKAYEETFDNWKAATEAWNNTYGNGDQWEEFAIGAISSVFGMPKVRGIKNKETGKRQSPITFEGGAAQDVREAKEERAKAQNVIDYLNNRLSDPKFIENFNGMVAHNYWQNAMDRAAEAGNKKAYKDAETKQFISDLINLHQAGILGDVENILEVAGDVSDISTPEGRANLDLIKENDKIRNEKNEVVGSQRGWFSKDGKTPLKEDKDIAKEVTERKDKLLKYIKEYKQTLEDLDYESNGVFSDDQLKELSWLRMRKFTSYDRISDMLTKLAKGSDKQTGNIEGFVNSINSAIAEFENIKEPTAEEVAKLNSLRELLTNVEEFKNADFSNFDDNKKEKYKKLLTTMVGLISENSPYFNGSEESKNAVKTIDDVIALMKDTSDFTVRYNEYMDNPGLIDSQIEQLREVKRKENIEKTAQQIEEKLINAKSTHEFKNMYDELISRLDIYANDEEYKQNYEEVLQRLRNTTNPVLKSQFEKMDNLNRLKGEPGTENEGYVTRALESVLQDSKNFSFVSSKPDESGISDKEYLIKTMQVLNAGLPNYFSVEEFEEISGAYVEALQEGLKASGKDNLVKAVKKIYNKWLNEVKNLEKEYLASLEKKEPKGDAKKSGSSKGSTGGGSAFSRGSTESSSDLESKDEGEEGGSAETKESTEKPKPKSKGKRKYGITDKDVIKEIDSKLKEFNSGFSEANNILNNIGLSDDKSLVPFDNIYTNLRKIVDEINDILSNEEDVDEAEAMTLIESLNANLDGLEEFKNLILEDIETDVDSGDLVSLLKHKTESELNDIISGKETLGLSDKKEIKDLQELAKEVLEERKTPTLQTQSDPEDEDDNNITDDRNETEGIENIDRDKTLWGNGTENPKNWATTYYNFDELNSEERRKVPYESDSATHKLMQSSGANEFIDRGQLADLCKDYADKHEGKEQLPIHFLLSDKHKYNDHHDVLLVIELNKEINELLKNRGVNLKAVFTHDGKSYFPIGQVAGYKYNDKSKSNATAIRNQIYNEADKKGFKNGIFVSEKTTEIENFYSGRLVLSDTDKHKDVENRSLNNLGSSFNSKNVVLGVYTSAGLKVPRLPSNADIEDLNVHNPTDRSGSVWYLLKGSNGIYYPLGIRVGRFNEEFDWENKLGDNKLVDKIYELASIICDENASSIARAKAKFELEDYIAFPTENHSVKNPIVFGKDEKTGKDLVSINVKGQIHNFNNIEESNGKSRVQNFLNSLAACNFRFQVKARLLNNAKYLDTLISSDVLTTNLISDHNVCGSFEIKPLEDDGSTKKKGTAPRKDTNAKNIKDNKTETVTMSIDSLSNEFVFDTTTEKCIGYKSGSTIKKVGDKLQKLLNAAYQIREGKYDKTDGYVNINGVDIYVFSDDSIITYDPFGNSIKILLDKKKKDYKEIEKAIEKLSEKTEDEKLADDVSKTISNTVSRSGKPLDEKSKQATTMFNELKGIASAFSESEENDNSSSSNNNSSNRKPVSRKQDAKINEEVERNVKNKVKTAKGRVPKTQESPLDSESGTQAQQQVTNDAKKRCHSSGSNPPIRKAVTRARHESRKID